MANESFRILKSLAYCGQIWKHSGKQPPNCLRSFDTISLSDAARSTGNKANRYGLIRIVLNPNAKRALLRVPDIALVLCLPVTIEEIMLHGGIAAGGPQGAGGHAGHRNRVEP